jgi:hypothetical protein
VTTKSILHCAKRESKFYVPCDSLWTVVLQKKILHSEILKFRLYASVCHFPWISGLSVKIVILWPKHISDVLVVDQ